MKTGADYARTYRNKQREKVGTVRDCGDFLLDRLDDFQLAMTSGDDAREWHGHVTPAIARFRMALENMK